MSCGKASQALGHPPVLLIFLKGKLLACVSSQGRGETEDSPENYGECSSKVFKVPDRRQAVSNKQQLHCRLCCCPPTENPLPPDAPQIRLRLVLRTVSNDLYACLDIYCFEPFRALKLKSQFWQGILQLLLERLVLVSQDQGLFYQPSPSCPIILGYVCL